MISWMNFWNMFFWISILGFVINIENFIKILIFSEISWLSLYCYTIISGSFSNDINLLSNSFFILGLASLEFSIGLLLLIIFKNINKSINLNEDCNYNDSSNILKKKKHLC